MATDEASFKQEIRESVVALYQDKMAWCPSDKFTIGVTDLHIIIDKFYGVEAKFCKKLPARGSSKILQHPFSPTQVRFMDKLNKSGAAVGCGLIWLDTDSALVVHPSQIDQDGNLDRDLAHKLWETQNISRQQYWDIGKLIEITRRFNG